MASRVLAPMAWASTSTASTFLRLLRVSASKALSCPTDARRSGTSASFPFSPNTWRSACLARPSRRASRVLVRSSVVMIFRASASLPISTPRAPPGPFSRWVRACTLVKLLPRAASCAVRALRLPSSSRADAINCGISAVASPRSTGRTAPAGSGGSVRMPLYARMLVPPTTPRTSVNTLDSRSQCASFWATSTTMRALPVSASSMRRTRPMGKPENVMSMPTTTPSESSAVSTRVCVGSNAPRAYSRYRPDPTINASVNSSSIAAFSSR